LPLIDNKRNAAWNGLIIGALAEAGADFGRPEYVKMAATAATAAVRYLRTPTGWKHVYQKGGARVDAFLADYAALALGMQQLAVVQKNPYWRNVAVELVDEMIARLWDDAVGGFFQVQDNAPDLIVRTKQFIDGAMPSGNSLAAEALLHLAITGDESYRSYTAWTIRAGRDALNQYPQAVPLLDLVLAQFLDAGLSTKDPLPVSKQPTSTSSAAYVSLRRQAGRRGQETAVVVSVKSCWHLNANPASFDFLIPTTLKSADGGALKVDYPAGRVLPIADGKTSVLGYVGTVTLVAHGVQAKAAMRLTIQACNDDGTCLAPSTVPVPNRKTAP